METIVLEVPFDVAKQYNDLPNSEKIHIIALLKAWFNQKNPIKQNDLSAKQRLLLSMDAMSKTALERGMTEEILDNILKEALSYESENHCV
jgi:hypothetical protein